MAKLQLNNTDVIEQVSSTDVTYKFPGPNHTFTVKALNQPITGATYSTNDDANSDQLAIYKGSTKLWGINESGLVQNPNVPSFRVRGSSTVTVNATGNNKIQWNTDSGNNCYNDGNFDTTNSRYTAPISGKYWFATNLRVDGASTYFRWMIVKNDNLSNPYSHGLHGIIGQYVSTNYHSLGISGSFDLSAGDFVSVYIQSHVDTSWTYLPQESNFSGFLIG